MINEERATEGAHHEREELAACDAVLGRVGGEARDGAGLVVVLEEDGCPGVGGEAEEGLCRRDGALELREGVGVGGGLEFVGALADVDDILGGC